MTVKEIVEQYLETNSYDGLCGDGCGCKVDDLMPCDEANVTSCCPGYLHKKEHSDSCLDCDCSYEYCEWCMRREKP